MVKMKKSINRSINQLINRFIYGYEAPASNIFLYNQNYFLIIIQQTRRVHLHAINSARLVTLPIFLVNSRFPEKGLNNN